MTECHPLENGSTATVGPEQAEIVELRDQISGLAHVLQNLQINLSLLHDSESNHVLRETVKIAVRILGGTLRELKERNEWMNPDAPQA